MLGIVDLMRVINGRPMWDISDIAANLHAAPETVQERWWWEYTKAAAAQITVLPANALPRPDAFFEGVPFWHPESILEWASATGRNPHASTVIPEGAHRPDREAWRTHPRIVSGELMVKEQIAERFGVTVATVRVWASRSPKAKAGGDNFPKAILLEDGTQAFPVAGPEGLDAWAKARQRLTEDGRILHPQGAPVRTGTWPPPQGPIFDLRRIIKKEFPGQRLRALDSGDGMIRLSWTGGPEKEAVRDVIPAGLLKQVMLVRYDGSADDGDPAPVEELGLSRDTLNMLKRRGIATIGRLCGKTREDLLGFRNVSEAAVAEIEEKLAARELSLKHHAPVLD
jgi:hypothetical protein